ncbi:SRPBCC domain-containing protein [Agromyces sp. MMS24-K17]|uniref:SRPBCC domain-containing protein n=1 Tax=Agromyces sp. MMS24-K17 TaxID=3372850 RepID=UPI0037550AD6
MSVTSRISRDEPGWLLEFEETYDTDAADLWSALTEPGRLARWMAGYRGDLRLGGHWQALGVDGDVYCDGVVEACDPPHGFTTTWVVVGEHPSRVTVTLEAAGSEAERRGAADAARTVLRLRHEQVAQAGTAPGWHAYLEALHGHLADPTAARDRAAWLARFDALRPEYAARYAELG